MLDIIFAECFLVDRTRASFVDTLGMTFCAKRVDAGQPNRLLVEDAAQHAGSLCNDGILKQRGPPVNEVREFGYSERCHLHLAMAAVSHLFAGGQRNTPIV